MLLWDVTRASEDLDKLLTGEVFIKGIGKASEEDDVSPIYIYGMVMQRLYSALPSYNFLPSAQ